MPTSRSPAPHGLFTSLPAELRVQILKFLPDFTTVLSTILVHSSIFNTYKEFQRSILLAVFRRQCDQVKGCEIGQVFWELVFAIRHDFVERDIAQEIFTTGWQIFREKRLEELLLPLGRALAWSYCLDGPNGSAGREEDAVALLERIVRGDRPFDHRPWPELKHGMLCKEFEKIWPKVTLAPVMGLLEELTGSASELMDDEQRYIWKIGLEEKMCVAEVQTRTVRVYSMEETAFNTLRRLQHGIQFDDRIALIGLVCPSRLPFRSSPVQWKGAPSKGYRADRANRVRTYYYKRRNRVKATNRSRFSVRGTPSPKNVKKLNR